MKLIRIYILAVFLLTCGYIWCAVNGYRILGDDNETTQQQRMGRSGHYFYHK